MSLYQRLCFVSIALIWISIPLQAQFTVNGTAVYQPPNCWQLTTTSPSQNGSIWSLNTINLAQNFDDTLRLFFGCGDSPGADGIVFAFVTSNTATGIGGGGIGYQGITPSLGVEFDTYLNGTYNDPGYDHVAIMSNGVSDHATANNLAGPVQASSTSANIEDCMYHDVRIKWDAATHKLDVYFDCNLRLTYTGDIVNTIFGGNPNVYWGFTSSTGAESNLQKVCIPNDVPPAPPTGNTQPCPGISFTYSIPALTGANYSWTIVPASAGTITSGGNTNSVNVTWNASASGGALEKICCNVTYSCASSYQVCLDVDVESVPNIQTPVTLCYGESYTIPNTAPPQVVTNNNGSANGPDQTEVRNIIRTNAQGCQYTEVFTFTKKALLTKQVGPLLICSGDTYTYCGQTFNPSSGNTTWNFTCGNQSGPPAYGPPCDTNITLIIVPVSVSAVITPSNTVLNCTTPTATLTASAVTAPAGGSVQYHWSNNLGNIPSVIVNNSGTYTVTVTYNISAGTSSVSCMDTAMVVITDQNATAPATPGPINGNINPCILAQNVTYSIAAVPTATSYTWTVTGGIIISGQGTTSISVNWGNGSGGQVCVTAGNTCGNSSPNCITITLLSPPATPGSITGNVTPCTTQLGVSYSIASVTNATTYTWTVTGGTIASGQGTTSITVNWGNSSSGQVCVTAGNTCGNSAQNCLSINLMSAPASPGAITGTLSPCTLQAGVSYSIANVSNATTYNWTVTGGTIASGQGTTSITVNWGNSGSGQVCVNAGNTCGNSTPTCIAISMINPPTTPAVSGPTPVCQNNPGTYSTPAQTGVTYAWSVPTGATITAGQGTNAIDVNYGAVAVSGNVCVTVTNSCGNTSSCFAVTVNALPPAPLVPSGLTSLCAGDMAQYTIPGGVGTYQWTVPSGASILSGQGSNTIMVSFPTALSGSICASASNSCGLGPNTCLPVNVHAYPVANPQASIQGCPDTISLGATPSVGNGTWTFISGPNGNSASILNPGNPNSQVVASSPGDYYFLWTENNFGCSDADTLHLLVYPPPVISNLLATCVNNGMDYTVSFDVNSGTAPIYINNILNGQHLDTLAANEHTFVSPAFPSNSNYSIQVHDQCYQFTYSGTFNCQCLTGAGTMSSTLLEKCVGQTVQVMHNNDATPDGNDVGEYILHDALGTTLGTIISINQTGIFGFVAPMLAGQTYYISYVVGNNNGSGMVDLNDGCLSVSVGQPVIFYDYPQAIAGADQSICGDSISLFAVPSIGVGTWSQFNGTGIVQFGNQHAALTTAIVNTTGTYNFIWTENNHGCIDKDTVAIHYDPIPVVSSVQDSCNNTNTGYFTIIHIQGGTAPYTVNNNQIAGAVFTSVFQNSGDAYSYTIADANGCGQVPVTGSAVCDCLTMVGSMNTNPLEVCVNAQACATYNGGEVLDGNDLLEFILFSGDIQTGIIQRSNSPCFNYLPSMMPEVTYYIAAIAGNNNGLGHVSLSDPCLDLSELTPVVFHQLPTATIGTDQTICEGQCANLSVTLTGNAPFNLTFSDGSVQNAIAGNALPLNVCPTQTTLYGLALVTDAYCSSNLNSNTTITVNHPVSAEIAMNDVVCNTSVSGFPTTRNFNNYILNGDTNGFWTDVDNSGASGTFPNLDFNGVAPGTYTFSYTLSSALAPCVNPVYTMEITVSASCSCPDVSTNATLGPLCSSSATLDLSTLVPASTAAGSWSMVNGPAGNTASITGSLFNANGSPAGSYTVRYTLLTPPPGICPDHSDQTIVVNQAPEAGTALSTVTLCAGIDSFIVLQDLIANEDAGGIWAETSSLPSSGGAFNAANGSFSTFNQIAGTYTFQYTVNGLAPCPSDQTTVTVQIQPVPTASAGFDVTINCGAPDELLGADPLPNLSYQWFFNNNQVGSSSKLSVNQVGAYILVVTNSSGCSDADTAQVTGDFVAPVAAISSNLPLLTCSNTSLILDGVASTPTGQLSYEWRNGVNVIGSNAQQSISAAGTYILTVTNTSNFCTDTAMIVISANNTQPTVSIQAPAPLNCTDTLVTLSANTNAINYQLNWGTVGGHFTGSIQTLSPQADQPGSYSLTVTDTNNGCSNIATVQVTENISPPPANASVNGELDCATTQLTLNGAGSALGAGITYQWYTFTGNIVNGATTLNPVVDQVGLYYILVNNGNNGCQGLDSVLVTQNNSNISAINLDITEPSCHGFCDGVIRASVTGGTPPYSYAFDGQPFTSQDTFTDLCTGNYNLVVSDAIGCTFSQAIFVNQPGEIFVDLGPDTTIVLGESIHIEAVTNPNVIDTFYWDRILDSTCILQPCLDQIFTPLSTTTLHVTVANDAGCMDSDDITVFVRKDRHVYIPNIFSPNDDGINDFFFIQGGKDVRKIVSFQVYDRWGTQVFQNLDILPNDEINGWNGRFRDRRMNPGVFVYWALIEFIDGEVELYKGDVTIE